MCIRKIEHADWLAICSFVLFAYRQSIVFSDLKTGTQDAGTFYRKDTIANSSRTSSNPCIDYFERKRFINEYKQKHGRYLTSLFRSDLRLRPLI